MSDAPRGPWSSCAPCAVVWLGLDVCWSCGAPGRIGDPPRIKEHAELTMRGPFGRTPHHQHEPEPRLAPFTRGGPGLFVHSQGRNRPARGRCRPRCDPMPVEDCVTTHPTLGVACQLPAHPHKQAHHASGSDDGVQWSLFWWRPASIATDPDGKADRPVMSATV